MASAALAKVESLLPKGMSIRGPPVNATASRPAIAMMSAQETVLGQAFSSVAFTPSMMSSLLIPKLEPDSNSLVIPFPDSSMMDPSHPCSRGV